MSKFDSDNIGNNLIKVDGKLVFKLQDVIDKSEFTKYSLAKYTHIRYDTICNYCTGNVTLMNVEYLKIFCSVLNCNLDDIVVFENTKK